MKRIFFNLYIVLTIGLLFINWTGELLWQEFEHKQHSIKTTELNNLAQLAVTNIELVTHYPQAKQLELLNRNSRIQTSIHPLSDFSFIPDQENELKLGNAVQMFAQNGDIVIYILAETNRLYEVKLKAVTQPINNQNTQTSTILTVLSYILLAGLIFIWTRPLWQDIDKLMTMTAQFTDNTKKIINPLSPRSVVYPLGQTLSKMSQKIVQLIALQKQMTHAISHDIRTPLARLKFSMAIMTNTRQEQTEFTQLTQDMSKDIEEVEQLIDEMLTYGRLDTVQSPLNIERVDVTQLMENLVEKMQRQSSKKLVLTPPKQVVFYCDGHLLERAIQNIVVNGLRYAESKVAISVQVSDGLSIEIEDDGPGIDPDLVGTIFEPFTRLENSRNKTCGGFGLGLSIAEKIVVWHAGEIKVKNSEVGGAIFNLHLPVVNQS